MVNSKCNNIDTSFTLQDCVNKKFGPKNLLNSKKLGHLQILSFFLNSPTIQKPIFG